MKSVVVEASTVAKSIEIAWDKAGKPEEFFIRILQEHHAGFLGFGSQKAKIVLFFKNLKKSDSPFPTVLKQKEYSSFFGNKILKVPEEVNVVDSELNKSVSVGGQKKKHNKSSKFVKSAADKAAQQKIQQSHSRPLSAAPREDQDSSRVKSDEKSRPSVKQVKIQKESKPQLQKTVNSSKVAEVKKKKISSKEFIDSLSIQPIEKSVDKKDDVVASVARVLKKVQSQKIVTDISRPVASKVAPVENKEVIEVVKSLDKSIIKGPRVVLKLKRRPLTTENQGVSGITKSSKTSSRGIAPRRKDSVPVESGETVDKKE